MFSATATAASPPFAIQTTQTIRGPQLDLQQWARLDLMFQNETPVIDLRPLLPVSDLREDMTEQQFARAILRNSLNRFLDEHKEDTLAGINKAAQGLSGDMKVGSGSQHQIKLRMNPLSGHTRIQYRGFANAELAYDLGDRQIRFEVSNQIGSATVVASHVDTMGGEKRDTLGLRWEF